MADNTFITKENKKKLTQDNLSDIILCDPITSKGLESLGQLGLNTEEHVSPDYFYDNLYITPKYREEALFNEYNTNEKLEYSYSVSVERFKELKAKLENFEKKFTSDTQQQSPLIIIGTAGNGKSIEANFKIRNPKRENKKIASNHIVFNLEKSLSELTYETTFSLDDEQKENSLWLICMALIEGLYKLIEKHYREVPTIVQNHHENFIKHNAANEDEKYFISCIGNFNPIDSITVNELFKTIVKMVNNNNVDKSIEDLLKMTMKIMYCINPNNKNYIVFDNLEHYIKLNANFIPIYNTSLSIFFNIAKNITENLTNIYDRIHTGESWRAFKIIIVMRRVSAYTLVQPCANYATQILGMGNDYNGHFDIWRIWKKKKKFIWEKYLKDKFDNEHGQRIITIIDDMMDDNPGAIGFSYQELISVLMNAGIRRNGRAQAHAAICVYDILHSNNIFYINFDIFQKLLYVMLQERTEKAITVTRYIYRRALIEIQYKRMIISEGVQIRFYNLFIGTLSNVREGSIKDISGQNIKRRDVKYDYPNDHVTFVHRILSYLSHWIDTSPVPIEDNFNYKTGMFEIKSLHDLMTGVFLNPVEKETKVLDLSKHFLPLAKVLNSLGNMSYEETKTAPFIILSVKDSRFYSNDSNYGLANILKEIWDAGAKESKPEGKYNNSDFGVRLTEAGDVFLRDIQPSFSFFSALYCSEEVPLFFLIDFERIKIVISTVYRVANNLCEKYEFAASSFCGPGVNLYEGNYLPKYKSKYITFRARVKEMHICHLELYKDYINKNAMTIGLQDETKELLIKYINTYIRRYKKWKTSRERSAICF